MIEQEYQCEGCCPKCGYDTIETLDQGINDSDYYYESECLNCHATFTEFYEMKYACTMLGDSDGDV